MPYVKNDTMVMVKAKVLRKPRPIDDEPIGTNDKSLWAVNNETRESRVKRLYFGSEAAARTRSKIW